MNDKEKKAFVARMKKGKKDAAKGIGKQIKRGGTRFIQVPDYKTGKPANILVKFDKRIQYLEKENKQMREFIRKNRGKMTRR
jgi:hypothetical protein